MEIELTEEVVAALVGAEPTLFDTIERMIIVTNDAGFSGDWATTGPWPYTLPAGFTRPISVSIQGYQNPVARFTHGLLHQFGLVDLYAHEGVVFPRPYVDDWDNMGGTFNNVHPLIWSKERAGWPAANGDTVFGTFAGQASPTADPAVVHYDDPGVITGGTGRYAGVSGDYAFQWQYVVEGEDGTVSGRAIGLAGRARLGAPAGADPKLSR